METIKQSSSENEGSLRLSKRIRKPTVHFTLDTAPSKKTPENASVKMTYNKPKLPPIHTSFISPTSIKLDTVLAKGLKQLKISISDDYIVVYYSREERRWKHIKNFENIDIGMTYRLRVYKKPEKKVEVKAVEAPKVALPVEESQKNAMASKTPGQTREMMQLYGFYCYWYYMMSMRGYQVPNFSHYGQN
ncbi:unnamed protein product [Blepharisma stoltei]|uniref:Uncharacterized protein n=1 Tax=Blepharisma stoltei TaxID=1481888 RepID=A0AAU9IJZ9_9CILI|nr:unnamed protein product [Blepharisma stoltei]